MLKCKFCEKFNVFQNQNCYLNREWYDHIIAETENFFLVPALGQFIEGYLLIVSKSHYSSMSLLDLSTFNELIKFSKEVSVIIEKTYGKVTIFEHGSINASNSAGCCVDHAHWHILPLDFDLKEMLIKNFNVNLISDETEILSYGKKNISYLYYANSINQRFILDALYVPSQFFRIIIANKIGLIDNWDWRLYPYYDNIKNTIKKIRNLIPGGI